nr:hypothetical protein [Tanacetum cinerariifolium]
MLDSQVNDKSKTGVGYHAVPPSYTRNFMPPKPDLILVDVDKYVVSESVTSVLAVATNESKTRNLLSRKSVIGKQKTLGKTAKVLEGNPQLELQEKGVIDSGCSRHMTRNMSYLSEYEVINGGYVAFGGDPKGGKNTSKGKISTCKLDFKGLYFVKELKFNLFSVLQMCDKKNSVLFTNTECVVLSPDFKLLDESQVLLRVPRKNNMYSVDLKNVASLGGLTCLFAKATLDESNLWHRRLGHINFKTMNKLRKENLVRGLPSKVFKNDHTCVACQKGKQHKASYETSGILKDFMTGIENLIDHEVKIIRCDNETEFKNKEMNQFCEKQGIKREFSVARTLQHNGVAERKNKTLIEAARTMLADSKLPTTFWIEAFNIACYVQNRVDDGFFIGYSVNSKEFRVFNSRTRIVEETLHITFLENKPNIAGSGPTWLFDIDRLTKSMNYKLVIVGNQSNGSTGKARMETVPDKGYILLLLWTQDLLLSSSSKDSHGDGFKPSGEEEKKDAKDPGNEDNEALITKEPKVNQEKENVNSTNRVNVVSSTVNAASYDVNVVGRKSSIKLSDDPNMPDLEDVSIFEDSNEDVGAEADMTNLDTNILVSLIPTTRIHKDHLVEQIIGDIHSAPQTRRMTKSVTDHEPKKQVWTLVDLPYGKRAIGTKWIYRNKKDEGGIVVRNKARLVTQGYTQEEGIDYDEVFYPVAKIEAIRIFLAYTSFKDFVVYEMDLKSAFLYGKIEEEVYVCQPLGFEDLEFPDKVYKVEKALYGLHQAPRACQDKYVDEILKKFGFSTVKTASTSMETLKPLIKDENAKDIDVRLYRSMIGSLMYLTSSRPDIMFAVYSPFDLEAYTDSDYDGASLDRKSITDVHNLVAFLSKPTEFEGFKKIIDFLNANPIKYALTVDPTIYTSCIEIFLVTAKAKNINREAHIHAKVDKKKVIISEVIIRRDLKFKNEGGVDCLSNEVIFKQLPLMGYENLSHDLTFYKAFFSPQWKFLIHTILQCLSAKTTAWNDFSSTMASAIIFLALNQKFNFSKYIFDSMVKHLDSGTKFLMYPRAATTATGLDAEQDMGSGPRRQKTMGDAAAQTRSERVSKFFNDPPLSRVNILGSREDRLQLKELIELCTKLSKRVLNLETTKTTQAKEISSLKRKVKRLEKKKKSITHGLKRLYKFGLYARVESSAEEQSLNEEDASKQGRNIADIDADAKTTLVDETAEDQGRYNDQEMFDTWVLDDEEVVVGKAVAVKELKNKSFDEIQKAFDKTMSWINPFVSMDTKVVKDRAEGSEIRIEESSKRAGEDLQQESAKKQKVHDDKKATKLKRYLEIVPDDEDGVTINATPLSSKSLTIIDYKIYKEGRKSYFQIIRLCESNSHYGYECSQQVPLVYELEPCYIQSFSDNTYPHDSPGVTPHIDHHCCYKCGDSLDGFFCHQCTCEFCRNSAHYGYNYPSHVPFAKTLPSFPHQYLCCENCEGPHETLQCQPMNYYEPNPCYDNYSGFDQIKPSQYSVNPTLNIQNELNDHELFINELIQQKLNKNAHFSLDIAITLDLPTVEPEDSPIMGDEHLDNIPKIESNEFIKSSVKNLVPSPSESEDKCECDLPVCNDFTTFSNLLFDADDDFSSSNDESFSNENIPKEIYSNPFFDEEIISNEIDPHHFNAESDLIESLLNQDSSIIFSSLKIDSLLDEFVEFISKISDAAIESFSPSHIPVDDIDFLVDEIDSSFTSDDSMPPGIKKDDYDSERDILIFEELLSNDSLSLPENESFHFDIPSSPRPPAKPPDDDEIEPNLGILTVKMMGDISKHYVPMPRFLPTQPTHVSNLEKSPHLLSHRGLKALQLPSESPMMIYGENIPILDVLFLHFYPP